MASLLSEDIELQADSGGKVPTIRRVLQGKEEVLDFLMNGVAPYWRTQQWTVSELNGRRSIELQQDGMLTAAITFHYDETGRTTRIYVMRNPDKLAQLTKQALS